ncbi:hypothetical protein [Bacillus albus]|nr:hypothetical protein [Bacillus albus]
MDKAVNVGERKVPSKKAVDQFISVYMQVVKRINCGGTKSPKTRE